MCCDSWLWINWWIFLGCEDLYLVQFYGEPCFFKDWSFLHVGVRREFPKGDLKIYYLAQSRISILLCWRWEVSLRVSLPLQFKIVHVAQCPGKKVLRIFWKVGAVGGHISSVVYKKSSKKCREWGIKCRLGYHVWNPIFSCKKLSH